MIVETVKTIDGNNVEQIGKVAGMKIFQRNGDSSDTANIYFVNQNGIVCGSLRVEADCVQNMGFIDVLDFKDIPKEQAK